MGAVTKAAKDGRRETLVALRDSIAAAIDAQPSGRDVAALSKRLLEIMDAIDAIDAGDAVADDPLSAAKAKAAKRRPGRPRKVANG